MQRARGGYTTVEVLIVLAISALTFFAAVRLFAGQQGKTQFSQAIRDIQSRVQSTVNDVRVSTYPFAENYRCSIDFTSQRPRLTSGSASVGTNTECIFLGKAVLFESNSGSTPDRLRIYTVLGNRTQIGSSAPVKNFNDVNAEPMLGEDGNPDLTETFSIPFGIKVQSARQDAPPTDADAYLMGFYNSLQPTGLSEGSQTLKTVGYVGVSNYSNGTVKTSIRGSGPATRVDSKVWTICFASGTSNEFAQLIVNTSLAGITSDIKYVASCT